jgi:hypothetical protein
VSAHSCNRFGQVSAYSVVTVPFWLDVRVSHSACSFVTVLFWLDVCVSHSACGVVTVPFWLDVRVSHSAQCRIPNSVRTSSSCAGWEICFRDAICPAASLR